MIARFCLFACACFPAVAAGWSGAPDQAALIKKLEARTRKVVRDGTGAVVEVSINNLRFTDADLEFLKPFPGLRILDLTYTGITDAGVERVVASHPALEWLDLGGTKATAACVKHLAKLKRLRFLRLYGASVTDETIRELRAHNLLHVWHGAMRSGTTDRPTSPAEVNKLELDNTHITPAGLREFADFKNVTNLYYPRLEDATLQTLGEMKLLHALWLTYKSGDWSDRPRSAAEVTMFSVPRFNSLTAAGLKPLGACTNLKHLSLWDFKTTPDALKVVGTFKSLEFLALGSTTGDAGLEHLTGLENLQSLQLPASAVSDRGLKEIGRLKSLRHLNVTQTKITAAGLKHLAGLRLDHLEVNRAILTDETLQFLRDQNLLHALGNTKNKRGATLDDVIFINLDKAPITDASIPHLTAMKSLQGIWLRDTGVTEKGLAELRRSCPKLRVVKAR